MNIFIYSDESGVFDKIHNEIFVFGGLMFFSKDERDEWSRRYIVAERIIRNKEQMRVAEEVKATTISNAFKGKLYRALNRTQKFGIIIEQKKILDSICTAKKSKQRYLDFAYKIAVKRKFEQLIENS